MRRKIDDPKNVRVVKTSPVIRATLDSGISVRLDSLPDPVSVNAFVCAFLPLKHIRRLLTKSEAEEVCVELGLALSGNEKTDCKNIHAYYNGKTK